MILGFSTGTVFRKIPSISKEIIDICRGIGCNAIELNAMTLDEVELYDSLIKSEENLSDFKYVSMHSPGIGVVYKSDAMMKELLKKLEEAYAYFNCKYLVVHPSLIDSWEVFNNFPFKLAVENMSRDTAPLHTPDQLKDIFEKNKNYKMTFDVKHAFESGGEKLAEDIYKTFEDRIGEIHLSGYNPNATKHEHRPLVAMNQPEIVNFVKDKQHIPIIIESDCEDAAQMKVEYEYIKNLLEN